MWRRRSGCSRGHFACVTLSQRDNNRVSKLQNSLQVTESQSLGGCRTHHPNLPSPREPYSVQLCTYPTCSSCLWMTQSAHVIATPQNDQCILEISEAFFLCCVRSERIVCSLSLLPVEWIGKLKINPADVALTSTSRRALPYAEVSTFLVTSYV